MGIIGSGGWEMDGAVTPLKSSKATNEGQFFRRFRHTVEKITIEKAKHP
jgi:hypothetical protein